MTWARSPSAGKFRDRFPGLLFLCVSVRVDAPLYYRKNPGLLITEKYSTPPVSWMENPGMHGVF